MHTSAFELSFGQWLRARRKDLDLTQAQLGQMVGCAAVTLHKFETGQLRPSRHMAERLADQLALTEDEREAFIRSARAQLSTQRTGNRFTLPVALSSFVGREREIGEIRRALARSRLVMLTGPGGVGKTRLALETARSIVDEDGPRVCWSSWRP